MKTKISFVLIFSIVAFIFWEAKRDQLQQTQVLSKKQQSLLESMGNQQAVPDSQSDLRYSAEERQQLAKLKPLFRLKKTEFESSTWYQHQYWFGGKIEQVENGLKQNTLMAKVDMEGNLQLVSNYFGKKTLSHNQIFVKIGEQVFDSTYIPTAQPSLGENLTMQEYLEVREYNEEKDQVILRQIAENTNQEIRVLFRGKDFDEEIILKQEEKEAIKACYDLASILAVS